MSLSSEMQGDLVNHLSSLNTDSTVDKYNGQLDVDDIKEAAVLCPFILVFYNGAELTSDIEKKALYNARTGFQILVGSNNIATADSMNDDVLDRKDNVITQLAGLGMTINSRVYETRVIGDSVLIRDKDMSIVSIRIEIIGQR